MTQAKTSISYQVILGDSLTDGGELQQTQPLLAGATELPNSPNGRFTDGYTWADDVARSAALDVLKEQFIVYIKAAIKQDELKNPDAELKDLEAYIRAIDLEKFHPDTFSYNKLKDSYLKRHFLKQEIVNYVSSLNNPKDDKIEPFLEYLKQLPLAGFNPEFNIDDLYKNYGDTLDAEHKQEIIDGLKNSVNQQAIDRIIEEVKQTYKTSPKHTNIIFNHIDSTKFDEINLIENCKNFLYGSFSLGDYQRVLLQGKNFIRRFAEGGLSAHAYSAFPGAQTLSLIVQQVKYTLGEFELSFANLFVYPAKFIYNFIKILAQVIGARLMLSSLNDMTNQLLKDDEKHNTTDEVKKKTLVTEWTGGNDFITVNGFASEQVCDDAVTARINNIIKLYDAGYRHFALLELPDLGKTPRYQSRSPKEYEEMTRLVKYCNTKLHEEVAKLDKSKYPELDVQVLPIFDKFNEIYDNPESFGLPKNIDKTHRLLDKTPENENPDGYMFWDDVHPSNLMHRVLGQEVYKYAKEHYNLEPSVSISEPCSPINFAKGLLVMFGDKYIRAYNDYNGQMFSFFKPVATYRRINYEPQDLNEAKESLQKIYELSKTDTIVKQSLIDMGWLSKDGQIPEKQIAPLLQEAYLRANPPVVEQKFDSQEHDPIDTSLAFCRF